MVNDKFEYLQILIDRLSADEKNIIPVFLLRGQRIEYGLKYLLGWYPFKVKKYKKDFIYKATMGQVIRELELLHDTHLSNIITSSKELVGARNEVTHHILTTKKNIRDLEMDCKRLLGLTVKVEEEIHYFVDWAEDVMLH